MPDTLKIKYDQAQLCFQTGAERRDQYIGLILEQCCVFCFNPHRCAALAWLDYNETKVSERGQVLCSVHLMPHHRPAGLKMEGFHLVHKATVHTEVGTWEKIPER